LSFRFEFDKYFGRHLEQRQTRRGIGLRNWLQGERVAGTAGLQLKAKPRQTSRLCSRLCSWLCNCLCSWLLQLVPLAVQLMQDLKLMNMVQ
jgi:hypothetical protein